MKRRYIRPKNIFENRDTYDARVEFLQCTIVRYVRRSPRIVWSNRMEISMPTKDRRLSRTNTKFPLLHESE